MIAVCGNVNCLRPGTNRNDLLSSDGTPGITCAETLARARWHNLSHYIHQVHQALFDSAEKAHDGAK